MKKMLLIGGIISTVLPAMATDLDLSDYHLVSGENNTCEGPEGYNGFISGDVSMTPLYIQKCPAGSYLNSDGAQVQQHQAAGENDYDYYYVNACTQCTSGQYSPGVANPAPNANGVLTSTGLGTCPQDYPESDGHGRSAPNNVPMSEADCYKVCSNAGITSSTLNALHASSANYIGDDDDANNGKAYYGDDCTMHINTCADGYELINLATGGTFTTPTATTWSLVKDGRSYSGTFSCTGAGNNVCSASLTGSNITVPSTATYADNTDCSAYCGTENDWQANIAAAIADVANGNYLTDGTSFCAAKIVDITWTGVAEPGAAATCTYGEGLSAPTPDNIPNGYEFVGWTVGQVSEPEEPGLGD